MHRLTLAFVVISSSLFAQTGEHSLPAKGGIAWIESVSALRGLGTIEAHAPRLVYVAGYYSPGDGGAGLFTYSPESMADDNGGTIIRPALGSGRWLRIYDGSINVKWFGAKGDGQTDDTAAVSAAILAAENHAEITLNFSIYFPKSVYLVSVPGVLSSHATTKAGYVTTGLFFRGDGMFNSIIRCRFPSGGWLFDNNTSGTELQQTQFMDLGFEGMNPLNYSGFASLPSDVGGFKMTRGIYSSQGFIFERCRFDYFTHAFEFNGSNNASEIKFFGCKFLRIASSVYIINNMQSFNHEFVSTDIEQCYGDIFSIVKGGAIKFSGGSVIMFPDGTDTDRWFVHAVGNSGVGGYPFTFSGIRFELRGNYSNVLNIAGTVQAAVTFDQCLLELQSKKDKEAFCTIGAYATVFFHRCDFYEYGGGRMSFIATSKYGYGENGTMTFDSCGMSADFSDRCHLNDSFGAIRAMNCNGLDAGVVTGAINHWAYDFDLNGVGSMAGPVSAWPDAGPTLASGGSPANGSQRLKSVYLKLPTDYWTIAAKGVVEQTLKLPRNAIIKNIYLLKPGGGTDGSNLTFAVGNNDKSTLHLKTPAAPNNISLKQSVTDYFYNVGSSENERVLRFFCVAGTPKATTQGGFILVEYY